ncbi:conserved Plasmodium protein, unknown function [Plasmodium gallinaceum]|uniref:Uncharacterized protein n=1 Tax=Plasmodium gallinaceum TaxID=5849 RepID=A0A1J1GPV8_PLAGA|nr:conserved Plasmodium protein, unknown function [Plasmodium gallinaceum]CRG94541.1 conserved Plasmodium protein, unknown function [Plasmodium gallinaceum]
MNFKKCGKDSNKMLCINENKHIERSKGNIKCTKCINDKNSKKNENNIKEWKNLNSIKKYINFYLKKFKMKSFKKKSKMNLLFKKKKEKKLIKKDYLNILQSEKEYYEKYEENKIFIDNIKSFNMNDLTKDPSYFFFFYNLFVKGSYLNKSNLNNALIKDNKKKKKKTRKVKDNIIFLNGKQTRLLICDYLKILMNNIQNEKIINANFCIIDYVKLIENKNNDFLMNYNVKDKKEKHSISTNSINSLNDKSYINDCINSNVENNKNEIVPVNISSNVELTNNSTPNNFIKISEDIFNKILNNFVTELKSFFFSLINKVKSSKLLAKLITVFCEIFLILTPYYVSIINFIEILNDFANIIPLSCVNYIINFLHNYKNKFIEKYKEFQNFIIFNDPVKTQSVGARLIGFIKTLQKKIKLNKKDSLNIFFLNLLLSECLPINHLGFCNRQSLKNNFNFLFYDSFEEYKSNLNNESIIYDDFELNIQENIKNYKKIKNIIENEMNGRFSYSIDLTNDGKNKSKNDNNNFSNLSKKEELNIAINKEENEEKKKNTDNNIVHSDNLYKSEMIKNEDILKNNERDDKHQNILTHSKKSDKNKKIDEKNEELNNKDKNKKRKRENSIDKNEIKDLKKAKCNKLFENLNESNKNYRVYLSFIYLVTFVKFPEIFIVQNSVSLEDVYNAFKIFYSYVKNLKKENIINLNIIKEYMYNSTFDFLGNLHIYNILIRDENFIKVFFFNILLVINYLNYEHNIHGKNGNLCKQKTDRSIDALTKISDMKNKEKIRFNSSNNIEINNENTFFLDTNKHNEKKKNEEKYYSMNTNTSKLYQKNVKENNYSSKNKEINNKMVNNTKHMNQNIIVNSNDLKNSDTINEKIKKIIYLFNKDLMNYFDHFKNPFFKYLLTKEYCWYTWKKQLIGKTNCENYDLNFEFKNINIETQKKEKIEMKGDNNKNIQKSPVENLIYVIEIFESLNKKMKNYYELNKNNKSLIKNNYRYTKLIDNSNNINQTNQINTCNNIYTISNIDLNNNSNKSYSVHDINKVNNFLLEINKIYLRREAEFWELDDNSTMTERKKKNSNKKILIEKLIDKLEDYKKKMYIDNDPINEIEESEKSKHNPIFKFRLTKLFLLKYIDLYTIVKNKEFSTDCDFLYNLMIQMDKNMVKKKGLLNEENDNILSFQQNECINNIEMD